MFHNTIFRAANLRNAHNKVWRLPEQLSRQRITAWINRPHIGSPCCHRHSCFTSMITSERISAKILCANGALWIRHKDAASQSRSLPLLRMSWMTYEGKCLVDFRQEEKHYDSSIMSKWNDRKFCPPLPEKKPIFFRFVLRKFHQPNTATNRCQRCVLATRCTMHFPLARCQKMIFVVAKPLPQFAEWNADQHNLFPNIV